MSLDSLESNARLAHATTDLNASPDLDDALVQQGLSIYQAARDAGSATGFDSRDLSIPVRVHNGKIEFEIDLPRDIRHTNCFPSKESRRSESVDRAIIRDYDLDSDYAPSKPYACSARHEPRPIDERIVACSSRIRIEEVPVYGCSQRIKVEIDPPGFYLCSAHIRLKPDWVKDENPSEINLCVSRQEPGKRDWYACMQLLPIDGTPPKSDIVLCASKIKINPDDIDRVYACAARITPFVPREKADTFACVDRVTIPKLAETGTPAEPLIGCGKKVPGEPGFYRLCSATARKDYIPEFLEYEKRNGQSI